MTEIVLDREVLARLDLAAAIEAAAERIGDFFPSRVAFEAARQADGFARSLGSQIARGLDAQPSEQVLVPKWGGASRPATDMPIRLRITFDALVQLIRSSMPPGIVNESSVGADRRELERSLLHSDTAYVVLTDVANFYEHISHHILADELLELTAEDQAVEALEDLLGAVQGSEIGLPQGPPASGFLADVYLSIADRRLARAGVQFVRFSDDYRIAVSSWRRGMRSQQALETHLRELGLNINPRKTWTPRRSLYEQWLGDAPDELDDLMADNQASATEEAEDKADDEAMPGPYEWEGEAVRELERPDPAVEERLRDACESPAIWGTPKNIEQSRKALSAIRSLGRTTSTALPELLPSILRSFPHLTRDFCIALRQRLQTDSEGDALTAVAGVLGGEVFTYDWQLGWLLHIGIPASGDLPSEMKRVAAAALSDAALPWFVRGRSAVLLATEKEIEIAEAYRAAFDEAPNATQADFVLAAALSGSSGAESFVRSVSSDPILREAAAAGDSEEKFRW